MSSNVEINYRKLKQQVIELDKCKKNNINIDESILKFKYNYLYMKCPKLFDFIVKSNSIGKPVDLNIIFEMLYSAEMIKKNIVSKKEMDEIIGFRMADKCFQGDLTNETSYQEGLHNANEKFKELQKKSVM